MLLRQLFAFRSGDKLHNDRYIVSSPVWLGQGVFGWVVRARDVTDQTDVAIKVIRTKYSQLQQIETEVEVLRVVQQAADEGRCHHAGSSFFPASSLWGVLSTR